MERYRGFHLHLSPETRAGCRGGEMVRMKVVRIRNVYVIYSCWHLVSVAVSRILQPQSWHARQRRDVTRDVSQLWSRYELLWWRAGKLFMFELHDVTLDISLFIHPVTAINCYDASRVVNEICNILRMFSKRSWNFVETFRCEAQSCLAYMPWARRRNISLAAAPRLVGG